MLAQMLGVSLPTIKRWFSGQGLALGDLLRLLDALGLSLKELASMTGEESGRFFFTRMRRRRFL